jgi:predicted KAP-like P-loop ATPase
VGHPVGDHTDSVQAKSFQLTDSASQVSHGWHFVIHWLFNPHRVVLKKKTTFVIFTVEPLLMPTLESGYQGKVEQIGY